MVKKKICLVTVFFGEWPWYFDFFLKSCSYNLSIDFLIFSDLNKPTCAPQNVKFIQKTLDDISEVINAKLGLKIKFNSPYKLCDIKPSYGLLFSENLSNYDFWGHCDIDLIFGNIRGFITEDLLNTFDIISVRHDYPSGFFMLYRNSPKINSLFKESKDYVKVFSSQKHYCFDECNFQHNAIFKGSSVFDTEAEIESMMHVIKRGEREGRIKPYFDFCVFEGLPGGIQMNKGVLSYKNEYEILLYHFFSLKSNSYYIFPKWTTIPETFFIEKHGFSKHSRFSLMGIITHSIIRLRIGTRKMKLKLLVQVSKLTRPYLNKHLHKTEQIGTYFRDNRLIKVFLKGNQLYVKQGKFDLELKISPLLFIPNLFIEPVSGNTFRFNQKSLRLLRKDGQEEVFKKAN